MAIKFTLNSNLKPAEIVPHGRSELYGTGLTKKLGEQATKIEAKTAEQSLDLISRLRAAQGATAKLETQIRAEAVTLTVNMPSSLEYDQYQDEAIKGFLKYKSGCIIGAAGTGKTTVLKQVIAAILHTIPEISTKKLNKPKKVDENDPENIDKDEEQSGAKVYSIAFMGFTGRSVQQIKRSLDKKFHATCRTGHATLGYYPESYDTDDGSRMRFIPYFTASNKWDFNLIVVDEGSMFPIKLWNEVMAASKPNTRFIVVGDLNQLPPVMDRPILPFFMTQLPTFELKTIHRQALENPIIANSQRILKGENPVPNSKGFFIKGLDDGSTKASMQVLEYVKLLHKHGKFDPMTDALIVPMNKEMLGQEYLNQQLVHYFNPPKKEGEIVINRRWPIKASRITVMLAIGDKVMLLSNDNDLGLTNGQIGLIVDITINGSFRDDKLGVHSPSDMEFDEGSLMGLLNATEKSDDDNGTDEEEKEEKPDKDENQRQASHITTVKFSTVDGEKEVKFQTVGQYGKITHAYAFTCHKSQGGEYPNIIVAFHSAAGRMLTREWLYTAVTRARDNVYILCNDKAMRDALKRQSIKGKTLEEKAKSFLAQINAKDIEMPMLPKNELVEGYKP